MQAASGIESLRMESPVKKLDFSASNKENKPFDCDLTTLEAEIDASYPQKNNTVAMKEKPAAPAQKDKEEEEEVLDEPLLTENPQRFVLFPIKYHEVCDAP